MTRNQNRAPSRAARDRADRLGIGYQKARAQVADILVIMADQDLTWDDAEAFYDDPANQLLCRRCGWTFAMICPECSPGCGCNNGKCSGWRHAEYMTDEERDDLEEDVCKECGADVSLGSYERCACA
jgi:hypothetical protein